jgi:hypothetical protein
MAVNPAADYGRDVLAISDADELFSDGEGLDVLIQDCLHVVTCTDFLGPGGDGRGFDVRELIGASSDELESIGPILAEVVERDDRIDSATVTLTKTTSNGLDDVALQIVAESALGPFSITKNVRDLTQSDIQEKTV